MSKPKDDGGPAFPIPNDDRPGAYEAHPGMSLRDWFAGQALMSLPHLCAADTMMGGLSFEQHVARNAYKLADAMIAERSKQ